MSDGMAEFIESLAWELPYEVRVTLSHNWNDEGVAAIKRRLTEAVVSAMPGAALWVIPEDKEMLRGTLWVGPPFSGQGYPALVVRLDQTGDES